MEGEWRQNEAERLMAQASMLSGDERDAILTKTRWKEGHEEVLYWGMSYGTLLGQTLAAMHPSRISRMVIDGVLDAD